MARASAGWDAALRDGYRQKAFLMTKIDGRTRPVAAQRQLDESLSRLQTDRHPSDPGS